MRYVKTQATRFLQGQLSMRDYAIAMSHLALNNDNSTLATAISCYTQWELMVMASYVVAA